jgi:hypothetical protein
VLVQREKITVKLSVFVEDLFLFQGIEPNKDNFLPPKAILEGRTKHQAFLLERFTIRDVEGILLSGKVVKIRDFEMPEQGIGMGELMDFSYTYDIEYPLEAPADYLTFSQRMVDETAGLPAETRMEVLQAGSDTPIYVTLFPETPETLPFDWSRPPLTSDASEAEWDSWYERRIEQELGITNYSSVYSFLYIEDYEVRHEILIPLLTLQSSVYIPRRDEAFLDLDEQEEARRQVGAFFAAGNPIVIDGVTVQPKVDRIDFYGVALKDFAQQAPAKRVSMANARAGIILSYSCKNTPNNVALHWDQFNDDIRIRRSEKTRVPSRDGRKCISLDQSRPPSPAAGRKRPPATATARSYQRLLVHVSRPRHRSGHRHRIADVVRFQANADQRLRDRFGSHRLFLSRSLDGV